MSRRHRQRGSVLVETTLVMTLFLSLVLGVITLGYLIFTYNSLAFMSQQGARWAAVHGSSSTQPATQNTVQSYVLGQGAGLATSSLTVQTVWTPNTNPGSTVSVTVTYLASPLATNFLKNTLTLKSTFSTTITR